MHDILLHALIRSFGTAASWAFHKEKESGGIFLTRSSKATLMV
jgi:hypothetical protein